MMTQNHQSPTLRHRSFHLPFVTAAFTSRYEPSVILQIMLHERPSVKAIPQGEKDNVLFVLGNENNANAARAPVCKSHTTG
jgi:hypothetical protein